MPRKVARFHQDASEEYDAAFDWYLTHSEDAAHVRAGMSATDSSFSSPMHELSSERLALRNANRSRPTSR